MISVGKTTKNGIASVAYEKTNMSKATHLKACGVNEFFEIDSKLIIRPVDENGNILDAVVGYYDMEPNRKYAIEVGNKQIFVDPDFYTQISFMRKSEENKGNYYKCTDGTYLRKDEVTIPSYQKLEMPTEHDLVIDTVHDGKFYVERECVKIATTGQKIYLPNKAVTQENGKWVYNVNGKKIACEYITNPTDKRVYVDRALVRGKIVDLSKVRVQDGKYVIDGIETEPVTVGEAKIEVKNPIVEGSTIAVEKEKTIASSNLEKQRPIMAENNGNLTFTWPKGHPSEDGLVRVEVNRSRTVAKFFYENGKVEVYAEYNAVVPVQYEKDAKRVQKFNIDDMGEQGIRFQFLQKENNIATNIKMKEGKVDSYTMNGAEITDIKWEDVDGYGMITAYTINGVRLSNIEWEFGEVKRCTIHFVDENGNEETRNIGDLKSSPYKDLAITYKLIERVEDLKFNEGKVSFKMGEYKFTDAEVGADGTIGKCKLKKGAGKEEEIDLSTDKRFSHLSTVVKMSLDEQQITPLLQSRLLKKQDGKYECVADVVQTSAMENGVANATEIATVEQAVNEQEKFEKNDEKYETFVMDDNGKAHVVNDFENTYDGVAGFEHNTDIIKKILGKDKIEIKNGRVKIDSKKTDKVRDNAVFLGFAMVGFLPGPVGVLLGMGFLAVGAAVGILAPIARAIKQRRIEKLTPEKVINQIQKEVKKECQKSLNKLESKYARKLRYYKRHYSSAEYDVKVGELNKEFSSEYDLVVAKLQTLGAGKLKCPFDMSKKTKLTSENLLGYLAGLEQQRELEHGKQGMAGFERRINRMLKGKHVRGQEVLESRLIEKYGSVGEAMVAHSQKMANIKDSLIVENKNRQKRGLPELSLREYRKQVKRESYATMSVWSGVSGKINALKHSDEYKTATHKERREMVSKLRETLEKEIENVKVDGAEIEELRNKHNQSEAELCVNEALTHKERVMKRLFIKGDIQAAEKTKDKKKQLKFGRKEKLSEDEKFVQEAIKERKAAFVDAVASRVDTKAMRQMKYDKKLAETRLETVAKNIVQLGEEVDKRVDNLKEAARGRSYKQAVAVKTKLESENEQVKEICNKNEEIANKTKYVELIESKKGQVVSNINAVRVENARQIKVAGSVQRITMEDHKRQAKQLAIDEMVALNPNAYKVYCNNMQLQANGKATETGLKASFVRELIERNDKRAKTQDEKTVGNLFDALQVKHNIEENIAAEVYCADNPEEYQKFATEHKLDPNSEMARCSYYSRCKLERSRDMEIYKASSTYKEKAHKVAEKRVKNDALDKHDEVQKRTQRQAESTVKNKKKASKGKAKEKSTDKSNDKASSRDAAPSAPVRAPQPVAVAR